MIPDYTAYYNLIDKSKWLPGRWTDEPDLVTWHSYYASIIVRNEAGHFQGFISLPKNHPVKGMDIGDHYLDMITVHGGVSYSGTQIPKLAHHEGVEADFKNKWIIGIDGFHSSDISPRALLSAPDKSSGNQTYRGANFMMLETIKLAEALHHIAHHSIDKVAS